VQSPKCAKPSFAQVARPKTQSVQSSALHTLLEGHPEWREFYNPEKDEIEFWRYNQKKDENI
jgi:hypothetical protein